MDGFNNAGPTNAVLNQFVMTALLKEIDFESS